MALSFYLIAHSHGIALLDAMSDWRNLWATEANVDSRFSAAFQGWFTGSMLSRPFSANIHKEYLPISTCSAWILSHKESNRLGPLATLTNTQQGSMAIEINPEFHKVLSSWNNEAPIVSMLHGNEHSARLYSNYPSYDFFEPGMPVDSTAQFLESDIIDAHVNEWIKTTLIPLIAIKTFTRNPLIHILPPPPRENPQNTSHIEGYSKYVQQGLFAPDQLRLKWYKRYCRMLADRAYSIGCQILFPPAEAISPEGLLKEEYTEGLTHGNSKYGKLLGMALAADSIFDSESEA
jgi:hypothetical protein